MRLYVSTVEGEEFIAIKACGPAKQQMEALLKAASNCRWEELSDDMRWMLDVMVFGAPMPSHRQTTIR